MQIISKFEQFSNSFENEASLRVALIALIERMPNASNIRHLHGRDELGKDIVFDLTGAFDQLETIACVVKNDKISGSASSNSGARTVYHQAEQALNIPFPDTDGSDRKVTQVFVLCPHECPAQAIESIQDMLRDSRSRVRFICGPKLLSLFERFYPEYLLFQSGLFGSYLASLKHDFDNNQPTASVLFRSGFTAAPNALSSVYVRPSFFQRLHVFAFKADVPDLKVLKAPVSEEVVLEIQRKLRQIAGVVSAALAPSTEATALEEELQRFANDIRTSWQDAYGKHRRKRDLTPEETSVPRGLLQFDIAHVLVPRREVMLQRCRDVVGEIVRKVNESKQYFDNVPKHSMTALKSKSVRQIIELSTLSQQLPGTLMPIEHPERSTDTIKTIDIGSNLLDLVEDDLLIVGPAGYGKSSFCRSHALHDFNRLSEGNSDIWPVYVPLHRLAEATLLSFEQSILGNRDLVDLWRESCGGKTTKRRFRIYLDGLDEIPSIKQQEQVISMTMGAKASAVPVQIVVTSRDHVAGSHLRELLRIRIRQFDDAQIKEFLAKSFAGDIRALADFERQLGQAHGLEELMRVPLLATLILGVYRNTGSLPESRVSIYEMFIRLLAGGWDSAKKVDRDAQFGYSPKLTVLMRLATTLHLERRRDAVSSDVKTATKQTLPGLIDRWQRLLDELVQDGLLVPSGTSLAFPHLSFQEFLAAKDLFEPKDRSASYAFEQFLGGTDWWREVVLFYIELSPKPKQIEEFVRGIASKLLTRTGDRSVKSRVHMLYKHMVTAFPGSQPDFSWIDS